MLALFLIIVLPIILSLAALGIGWFLSTFIPITPLQGAFVWLASFAIVNIVIAYTNFHANPFSYADFEEEEEEEDDDDEEDKDIDVNAIVKKVVGSTMPGRRQKRQRRR